MPKESEILQESQEPIKIKTGKDIGDSRNKLKPHVVKPTTSISKTLSAESVLPAEGWVPLSRLIAVIKLVSLKEGNLLHSDPKAKADVLNRQFASVFTN